MESRSSLRKSSSSKRREALALLLRDGRTISCPTKEVVSAAAELERIGLITVLRQEFVHCAEPRDHDIRYTRNRSCQGRIHLREHADEEGHDYRCPECDRVVFPRRNRKAKHLEYQISVCPDKVIRYVRDLFNRDGLDVKDVAGAAFRIEGAGRDVYACFAELCGDKQFLARDWARSQPTLYIAVDKTMMGERFLPEDWVTKVCLADLLCGEYDLVAEVRRLAQEGVPREVLNASVPVYSSGPSPIIAVNEADSRGRRFLVEVREKTVRVNGVEVVASQAKTRYRVFRLLWQRFLDDLRAGRSPEQFRPLRIKEVARLLANDREGLDEDTVRRTLNRLQADIEVAVKKQCGDPISREDIIETIRRRGQIDEEFGYRINPRTVVACPLESTIPVVSATTAAARASRG